MMFPSVWPVRFHLFRYGWGSLFRNGGYRGILMHATATAIWLVMIGSMPKRLVRALQLNDEPHHERDDHVLTLQML